MTRSPAPQAAESTAREKPALILLFIGLMLSMLLASLSQTVLSTALPTMVGELNGVDQMLWIMTAYILASTIMMPVYGKMGDLIGRKSLLIMAILLFMSGSIVGGLAANMTWMIVARLIQGLGGGGLIILSQAIIADVVPARERGKYMGIMGGVFAVSSVAGPLLGGWFTESIGWRWTFWINLPLGALALLAAVFFLHLPQGSNRRPRVDFAGMGVLAITTASLVLAASWGGVEYAWTSPIILGLFATTVLGAIVFVMIERRAAEPIISLHLFRKLNFNLTTGAGLLIGVAMFGVLGYMPTYIQMATGLSATQAGFVMVPMMAMLLGTSVSSGFVISKTGRYKWMPITGAAIIGIALTLLSTLDVETPLWVLCAFIGILGIGLGLSMQVLVLIVQNTFPNSQVGTATASNNYFRQIGASLGSAVVGSLFTSRLTTLISEKLPGGAANSAGGADNLTPAAVHNLPAAVQEPIIQSYNEALTPLFLYMAPLALVAIVLLSFIKEVPLATTIDRDAKTAPGESADDDGRQPAGQRSGLDDGRRIGDRTGDGIGDGTSDDSEGTMGDPIEAEHSQVRAGSGTR
ncbi:MDR family MFS transporter [Arthrobacter castelli]|uniref:MDR family MFS transporter n=1 Tax=Arthrobacter castelli TaxID=271431 RepID=UPI000413787E|nr:MDR family MFS transporter [Arthrobacter castelli]